MKLGASILTLAYEDMAASIAKLEQLPLDYYHLDIMDGNFVPQLTFGSKMVAWYKAKGTKWIDTHLMVEKPQRLIEALAAAGADSITVHLEACRDIYPVIKQIKDSKVKAGVAINPGTSVALLEPILSALDLVLQMSVVPGFGGQKLIPATLENVARLKRIREDNHLDFDIQMDGGINRQTIAACQSAGADSLVLGSALVDSADWQESFDSIQEALQAERTAI